MSEPTILCPNCKTEIRLTESLAAPLLEATRKDFEQRLSAKDAQVAARELALRQQEAAVAKAQTQIDARVAEKVNAERTAIAAEEARKARLALESDLTQKARDLADLQTVIATQNSKLAEAQKAQADVVRERRELADKLREADLAVETKVAQQVTLARAAARQEADEATRLKLAEKDKLIDDQKRQLADAQRRLEQGSQQLQGEVQELELESLLRAKFPRDTIEPVPKGEFGGDVIHRVLGPTGQPCGTILWETKRTRNWSDGWLSKLREDQRAAKADLAIIVSQILPKGLETFDLIDGVWITSPRCAIPVAIALRHSLVELGCARQAGEGQQTKMEMVYQYLTGPRFRHRIQAIVEKFSDMQEDLDKERKALTKQWAKREEQIRAVIEATAGMYGDLQGIAGKTLQEIEGLDVKMLGDRQS